MIPGALCPPSRVGMKNLGASQPSGCALLCVLRSLDGEIARSSALLLLQLLRPRRAVRAPHPESRAGMGAALLDASQPYDPAVSRAGRAMEGTPPRFNEPNSAQRSVRGAARGAAWAPSISSFLPGWRRHQKKIQITSYGGLQPRPSLCPLFFFSPSPTSHKGPQFGAQTPFLAEP